MQIAIKTLTGKIWNVEVESSDTIENVKVKIQEQEGLPSDQFRLISSGRRHHDHETLAELNIREGTVLHMVVRMCGGW